ncbi:hypothetical protein ACFFYR_11945 [Paraburkholderia dipogonis]|uniref:hypothetical protein n=1 Tax=Paraburkholderia dipogonis TaxID=1211383 RepID=UPI0035EEA84A
MGYGVLRRCLTGYKIGPLFADSNEIAARLFFALTSSIAGEVFFSSMCPRSTRMRLRWPSGMA